MINLSLPVATPTPLLDYTVRHRHTVELRNNAVIRYYDKVDEYYDWKFKNVQEKHRLDEDYEFKKQLEEMQQYENIKNKKEYAAYRYLFYIGSNIDVYI